MKPIRTVRRGPTFADRRLAELEGIRDRALTEDEQLEVMRRAKESRRNAKRRTLYHTDPQYRERYMGRTPAHRAESHR